MAKHINNIIGIAIFFILSLFSFGFSEESITITTYYPSPYGSYNDLYVANNVGIGTTNPQDILHLAGTGTNVPSEILQRNVSDSITGGVSWGYIQFRDKNNAVMAQITAERKGTVADSKGSLAFLAGGDQDPSISTKLIYLKHDGNVGIGTASPDSRFTIQGGSTGHGLHVRAGEQDGVDYILKVEDQDGTVQAMYVDANGRIGIGTASPGYTLTVNGTTWCTSGAWSGSDLHWKTNIAPLSNSLDKICKLRGVEFDWKQKEFPDNRFPEGRQIGIIAQEIEKEFPELVTTDSSGYKAVAYDRFTAVLLEAIKAQQQEIEELKKEIKKLKIRKI